MAARVTVSSREKFQQEVAVDAGTLVVDEPVRLGGDGAGPDPYELLLAALGACTNMTLLMYAQRKKWPLEAVETTLTHRREHAQDCADCSEDVRYLECFDKQVVVAGQLTEEQIHRLKEIAHRCPVNQTLTRGVSGETTIRRAGEAPV